MMKLYKFFFSNTILGAWKLLIVTALGIFICSLHSIVLDPGHSLTFPQYLTASVFVFLLFLFGVGDIGVIDVSSELLSMRSHKSIYTEAKRFFLADLFFIVAHGILLLLLAIFCLDQIWSFILCLLVLAGANKIWLGLKLKHFNKAIKDLNGVNQLLYEKTWHCREAMINWSIINGVYTIGLTAIIAIHICGNIDFIPFEESCLVLTIVRCCIDMILCLRFYRTILLDLVSVEK